MAESNHTEDVGLPTVKKTSFLTSTLFSSVTGNGKLKYIAGSNVVEVFLHPSTGQVTTYVSSGSGVDNQQGVRKKRAMHRPQAKSSGISVEMGKF